MKYGFSLHAKDRFISRVHLRPRAVVHGELEGDDDVVLHAADLAAEGDALPAEAVDGLLELEGVDLHLLLDAAARGGRVLAEQGGVKGDALVAEHVVEERHHAVLDLLGREDAVAAGGVVDAEARVRQAVERALVVLRLETEVALHHDDDFAELKLRSALDALHVPLHKRKLFFRFCSEHSP